MAKTLDDVAASRELREKIARMFGGEIPASILKHNQSDRAADLLIEHGRDYMSTGWAGDNKDHKHWHIFRTSGIGSRAGALSRFSQNVGRILLKLYTEKGDTVVDPFAGHNSRMELCWRAGRNYIGCDISRGFMAANFELRDRLLGEHDDSMFKPLNQATIELHECDSRQMPVKNNAGNFTITSPPYWDLEDYGDEMGQLGKGNDYPTFLQRLGAVACENFRCLKSGSFCVWCVNDFRKDSKFYCYHADTIRLLRDAGFKMHDIAIIDLCHAFREFFASQIVTQKILPKRHEYALVFVKP